MKKKITLVVALALVLVVGVFGTLAYLTSTTEKITNTFTVGNVKITIDETGATAAADQTNKTKSYKMVPGNVLSKDPTVTVLANSEDCWVFVQVVASSNAASFLEYSINTSWKQLTGVDNVFYAKVPSSTTATTLPILVDNQVTVRTNVTEEMMEALTEATYPTLAFNAYAIQQANIGTEGATDDAKAAAAWAALNAQLGS